MFKHIHMICLGNRTHGRTCNVRYEWTTWVMLCVLCFRRWNVFDHATNLVFLYWCRYNM